MRDHTSLQSRSLSTTINNALVEFVVFDEPDAEIWVGFDGILAAAGYPIAVGRQRPNGSLAGDLRTIDPPEPEQHLVSLESARELMMRAAELGHCPAYQTDVFEVIASYARDELSSCGPCAAEDFGGVPDAEGGE